MRAFLTLRCGGSEIETDTQARAGISIFARGASLLSLRLSASFPIALFCPPSHCHGALFGPKAFTDMFIGLLTRRCGGSAIQADSQVSAGKKCPSMHLAAR